VHPVAVARAQKPGPVGREGPDEALEGVDERGVQHPDRALAAGADPTAVG